MDGSNEALVAAGYDAVYEAVPHAPALWQIWLDHAVGRDFPSTFSHISFATLSDLHLLAEALRLAGDTTLVDLACGMGGPSLWMASQLPIRLVGVDASPVAVQAAATRARHLGLDSRCSFRVGTFARTGLDDAEADAVLSLDALQYAPDKQAAFHEMARVLRPGARLAFMAFEVIADRVRDLPVLGDDPVGDFGPRMENAGFDVDTYEETPGWRARVMGAYQAILDQASVLEPEMGAEAYAALTVEIGLTLERDFYSRRVLAIATRR